MSERFIIVGGNAAGMSAAFKARRLNKSAEIVVYEATEEISVGACGIPYYVAGEFDSLDTMRARSAQTVATAGITLCLNTQITALDATTKTIQGVTSNKTPFTNTYTKLLIATGATPFIPPIEGASLPGVYTVKTLSQAKKIRKYMQKPQVHHVTIVGGGFIGIEMAEAALQLNKKVRLIELQNQLMPQAFDTDMADHLTKEMLIQGVDLHLNEGVTSMAGDNQVKQITTTLGAYKTDMVILALGVRPATSWLKDSGLAMLNNGAIVVNNQGQTSMPDMYAAGDCAAVPHRITNQPAYIPLATTANKLGRVIGEHMAGGNTQYPGTIGSSSIRFCNTEGARVGLSEKEALAESIPYKTITIEDKNHTNYTHGAGSVWVKLIYHPSNFTLLGAQLIGAQGAELRSYPLVIAIEQGLSVKELAFADFPYAPPFSRTWDILNVAGNVAK